METLLDSDQLPRRRERQRIALAVVEAKLAACVNILPRVQSIYRWQGVVESATEIPAFYQVDRSKLPGAGKTDRRAASPRNSRNYRPADLRRVCRLT
jgi:uncharacterized protein involved in tolerance to divalent cations